MPTFRFPIELDLEFHNGIGVYLLDQLRRRGVQVTAMAEMIVGCEAFDRAPCLPSARRAAASIGTFGEKRSPRAIQDHAVSFGEGSPSLRLAPCLRLLYDDHQLSRWGAAQLVVLHEPIVFHGAQVHLGLRRNSLCTFDAPLPDEDWAGGIAFAFLRRR
jgi:hypothetical protein